MVVHEITYIHRYIHKHTYTLDEDNYSNDIYILPCKEEDIDQTLLRKIMTGNIILLLTLDYYI